MTGLPAAQLTDANAERDLAAAKRVVELEIAGLQALVDAMGADVTKAIDIIARVKGRVVISGMGKSGHVARKIAATMASTGTPAMFVHPGEASHGDLGTVNITI